MNMLKTLALSLLIVLTGYVYYLYTNKPANVQQNQPTTRMEVMPAGGTTNTTAETTDTTATDTQPVPELNSSDYTNWATVQKDGYEFKHPNYFIKEENGYQILAYEPLDKSGEFAGLAIKEPFVIDDVNAYMKENIQNTQNGAGGTVTKEPQQISMPGFKSAYTYEIKVESGPNTGANKFFALQSPFTDKWVTIEYAENDNAEKVMQSFKFTK